MYSNSTIFLYLKHCSLNREFSYSCFILFSSQTLKIICCLSFSIHLQLVSPYSVLLIHPFVSLVVLGALLFSESLDILHPVLLLLVRQAGDFGWRRSGGPVVHPLDTRWFLETKPKNRANNISAASCFAPKNHDKLCANRHACYICLLKSRFHLNWYFKVTLCRIWRWWYLKDLQQPESAWVSFIFH